MKWRDSVALITGASRGIGREVARAASRRGAAVGLVARSGDELERMLAEMGGKGAYTVADVSDRNDVARAVAEISSALGPIDILVNNAGIGAYGPFEAEDIDTFEKLVRVNYFGTLYAMKAVVGEMVTRGKGHIVNIASIAGRIGAPFEAAYSASKFAVVGLSEAADVELSPRGVRVSLINPGPVDTDFFTARGAPYARSTPKPVPASAVAKLVIGAVEHERAEQYIPGWLRGAVIARHAAAPLYRKGAAKGVKG
jgi:short-subunit dehydrogenase